MRILATVTAIVVAAILCVLGYAYFTQPTATGDITTPSGVYEQFEAVSTELDLYNDEEDEFKFRMEADGSFHFVVPGNVLTKMNVPIPGKVVPAPDQILLDAINIATAEGYMVDEVNRMVVFSRNGERFTRIVLRFRGRDAKGHPFEDKGIVMLTKANVYDADFCSHWMSCNLLQAAESELHAFRAIGPPEELEEECGCPRIDSDLPTTGMVID